MKLLTNNPDLQIGTILKAARIRSGKTAADIATATGVSDRMVRFWERDIRGIGRGRGVERTEEVFLAYGLTKDEKEEVIRRVSLRKGEHVGNSLSALMKNHKPLPPADDEATEEMRVLVQLLALSPEKRQWVIQMANTYKALTSKK